MNRKYLVLGRMPLDATPDTHLAAGPWCFAGQEERFPDWENRYTFAPEPFVEAEALEKAAKEAQGLAAACIPQVVRLLRAPTQPALPEAYWDMALGCWLIMVTQKLVDCWWRVRLMTEAWGQEPLRVELLPKDCPFSFATELDYMWGGGLGEAYTQWVFSRVLEAQCPEAWEKVYVNAPPAADITFAPKVPQDFKQRLRQKVKGLALRMLLSLPFPPIKGFSLRQCLSFSRALRQNRNADDLTRSVAIWTVNAPNLPSSLDMENILLTSMPQALKKASHPHSVRPAFRKKTRVGTIHVFENTDYRLRLAHWRARGHKVVFVQHGGNYGNVRVTSMDPMMEYLQHAFITWGWSQQTPYQANFVPLPPALLADIRNTHVEKQAQLIYVGTEIPVYAYRMDSRLTPLQYVQYRDDKQWFFEALPADIQKATLYRPYFNVPGTLEDAPWLLPHFPHVHLCSGPLLPQLQQCRLLVLDHHGTTLLQAMAANIPSVLFWDRKAWSLCPETETLLDELAAADIWHPTAESAAMHIRRIWQDVPGWWASEKVQQARQRWADTYARTVDGPLDPLWIQTLKTL